MCQSKSFRWVVSLGPGCIRFNWVELQAPTLGTTVRLDVRWYPLFKNSNPHHFQMSLESFSGWFSSFRITSKNYSYKMCQKAQTVGSVLNIKFPRHSQICTTYPKTQTPRGSRKPPQICSDSKCLSKSLRKAAITALIHQVLSGQWLRSWTCHDPSPERGCIQGRSIHRWISTKT